MSVLREGEYTGRLVHQRKLAGAIVTSAQYESDACNVDWHSHENLHITFVFKGGGESESRSATLRRWNTDIFFYPAGEKHRWTPQPGLSQSIIVELDFGFLGQYQIDEAAIGRAIASNIDSKMLMLKMQKELFDFNHNSKSAINSLLLELVSESSVGNTRVQPRWVRPLREFLNENWDRSLTLEDLSREAGVHPVTISKQFRKYFSCTFGEYCRKLKIEKSISIIKNNSHSLTEVAAICGFADQSHFIRTFKKTTGMLPGEFRKI